MLYELTHTSIQVNMLELLFALGMFLTAVSSIAMLLLYEDAPGAGSAWYLVKPSITDKALASFISCSILILWPIVLIYFVYEKVRKVI